MMPRPGFLTVLTLLLLSTPLSYAQDELTRCAQPYGTLAVVEPQNEVLRALARYDLQSPTSLIRMMVQQSNCFLVVERGRAMQNLMQERELAASGQLQQGENVGGGQMRAADFVMTPEVIFSEDNAGGVGGAIGGLLGRRNRVVGAIAGGLKFKEAQTSLLVSDTRSGIQVAAAEGKARKTDFSLGMLGFGGGGGMAVGGYTNTNEGKVIAASFLDNYNAIVAAVQSSPHVQQLGAGGGETVQAGAVYAAGDLLTPKIDNVKLHASPSSSAADVREIFGGRGYAAESGRGA